VRHRPEDRGPVWDRRGRAKRCRPMRSQVARDPHHSCGAAPRGQRCHGASFGSLTSHEPRSRADVNRRTEGSRCLVLLHRTLRSGALAVLLTGLEVGCGTSALVYFGGTAALPWPTKVIGRSGHLTRVKAIGEPARIRGYIEIPQEAAPVRVRGRIIGTVTLLNELGAETTAFRELGPPNECFPFVARIAEPVELTVR